MRLLIEEGSNRAIAARMETSVQMVKNHLLGIFQKLGVENRLSLAIALIRNGVLSLHAAGGPDWPGLSTGVIRPKTTTPAIPRTRLRLSFHERDIDVILTGERVRIE